MYHDMAIYHCISNMYTALVKHKPMKTFKLIIDLLKCG